MQHAATRAVYPPPFASRPLPRALHSHSHVMSHARTPPCAPRRPAPAVSISQRFTAVPKFSLARGGADGESWGVTRPFPPAPVQATNTLTQLPHPTMKRKAQVQPAGSKKSKSNKPGIPGHRKDSIVKTDIAAMAANLHGVDPDELLGCVMGCVRVGWVGACGRGGVGGWVRALC